MDPESSRAYLGLAAAYVFLRVLAVIGTTAEATFPDSATYRHAAGQPSYPFVSLTGHAMRPFVAPLLYAIVPSDNLRTDAQVLISILTWLTLAVVVGYSLRDRRVRLVAVVVILAFSCTTAVTNWDRAILAESLSISFAVLALAAWIWFVKHPAPLSAAAAVASTTVWCFTKSATFPIVGLAAVLVALSMIRTGDRPRRGAVAAALILVSMWAFAANNQSDKTYERYQGKGLSQFNTNFALELRLEILNSPSDTAWFVSHGMPDPKNGLPLGYKRSSPMDDTWFAGDAAFTDAYLAQHDFVKWGNTKGRHVYEEFVLTHPSELISRFSRELPYMLVPTRNHLVYTTGPRDVLPAAAQSLLFDTTPSIPTGALFAPAGFGDVGLLAAAAVVLAFVARRHARDVRLLIIAGATGLLAFVAIAIGWVLSPIEIARALPGSVLLRLSLWLVVFVMLDAVVADRAPKPAT